jgi:hypothetical protein
MIRWWSPRLDWRRLRLGWYPPGRGKPLRATHHSSKTNGKTSCTWQLPKTAHGKHFTGTITDTYKGAKISRSFSVKIA